MSVFEGVIREEIERLSKNILAYKKLLEELPKGSLFIRKDYNSYFVYRRKRQGNKIVSEYLGPLESYKVQEEINRSNEYKRIKNNIKIAEEELKELKKAIKVYNRKQKTFK